MSRIKSRAGLVLGLAAAFTAIAGSGAGAASSLSISAKSTSAKTVVSAKAISVNLTAPTSAGASVQVSLTAAGVSIPGGSATLTSGTKTVPLTDTGVALAKQCSTVSYTVTATAGGKTATSSGRLSKSTSCVSASAAPSVASATALRCEFVADGAGNCMIPYPSNWYTKADPTSATGIRMNFKKESTVSPTGNGVGSFDPTEWNRNDGFSPTPKIVVSVPGLVRSTDTTSAQLKAIATNSGWPTIGSIGDYTNGNASVVLVDEATGARVPVWAELDSTVPVPDTPMLIHPAIALKEGHTYAVGLAGLKNSSGQAVAAPASFRLYRDSTISSRTVVEQRRPGFETIFGALATGGVQRSSLQLAWDFTVASTQGLTRRMLAIRDDAFAKLGDTNLSDLNPVGSSPSFTVTKVTNDVSDKIARRVEGTVTVPCYLTTVNGVPCGVSSVFNYPAGSGPDAVPVQNGTWTATYQCEIPRAAFSDRTTAGSANAVPPVIYGHGLLGGKGEVGSDAQAGFADGWGYLYCATDEIGFASPDVASALSALLYLPNFKKMADRTQQGLLNELYLGRALVNSNGFRTNPAFQDSSGNSLISGNRLYYDGNSQGGILGGVISAIGPDNNRSTLGVNGMTYSTLLDRSVDFHGYLEAYKVSYTSALMRSLGLSMLQDLWDRAEPSGYVNHITSNPLPNTPVHQVLMQVGLGDFQVANITADTEARTIGAKIYAPIADTGRGGPTNPGWGLDAMTSFPYAGSALVYFDSGPVRSNGSGGWLGNSAPLFDNVTAVKAAGASGNDGADPHEHPRRSAMGRAMKAAFLQPDGKVTSTCDGGPCYAGGWTGP